MDPRNIKSEVVLRITEDPSIPWQDIFPAIGNDDQSLDSSPKQRHSFTHSTMPTMTETTNHCLINRHVSDRWLQPQLLPASTQPDFNPLHPTHIEIGILSPTFSHLEPLCTCTASTIETLSSLCIATIHPLSFPQTLSTNDTAITNLSHQLACSYSLDFPSILLIAATITKLLSTY